MVPLLGTRTGALGFFLFYNLFFLWVNKYSYQ